MFVNKFGKPDWKGENDMEKTKYTFDYSKLKGRIKEKYETQTELSKHISYGFSSLSMKLNNEVLFSQPDILELLRVLEIPNEDISEYFFKLKIRKTELEFQTA